MDKLSLGNQLYKLRFMFLNIKQLNLVIKKETGFKGGNTWHKWMNQLDLKTQKVGYRNKRIFH